LNNAWKFAFKKRFIIVLSVRGGRTLRLKKLFYKQIVCIVGS